MAETRIEAGQGTGACAASRTPAGVCAALGSAPGAARLLRALPSELRNAVIPAAGVLVLAAAVAALAASPTLFIADAWPDMFLGLEAALRWAHGHRPHEDFHTPIGAAYIALMGMAGAAADFGPRTLINANIVMAVFTAAVVGVITFRRLSIPFATLLTVYWGLFALSPRRIAGTFEHVAFLAAYNKWGFALTAGLWLAGAAPPRRGKKYAAFAELLCVAAALCFLFYLKVTFFAAAAAPFLLAALFAGRAPARRAALAPLAAGLGLIAGVALLSGVDLAAYARDVLMAARAAGGLDTPHLAQDVRFNILLVGANIVACLLHFRAFAPAPPDRAAEAGRVRLMFLALLLLSLAVNNQNTSSTIPLLALPPLLLSLGGLPGATAAARSAARLAMILIPAGYWLWWGAVELRAVLHHHDAARQARGVSFCERTELAICRVRVTDTDRKNPEYDLTYARTRPIHEELYDALDPLVSPGDRIVQFGFFNMLNARYGLEPARGGLLFWHYGRNFDEGALPAAEAVFAGATLVVINRRPVPNSRDDGMMRLYGRHVREHFVLAAETPHWRIYRRP